MSRDFHYEIGSTAQDIAGGLMVTMPSEKTSRSPETGPLLEKYLKGRKGVSTENRVRILRLIENMTLSRNAVGYLTESMHGRLASGSKNPNCSPNTT